jgi:hypothetical protein
MFSHNYHSALQRNILYQSISNNKCLFMGPKLRHLIIRTTGDGKIKATVSESQVSVSTCLITL